LAKKRRLGGAVGKDIVTRLKSRRTVRGRPDGERIITGVSSRAIGHDGIVHTDVNIDAVGNGVAEPAVRDDHAAGIGQPCSRFGMFHPDAGNARVCAEDFAEAVIGLGIVPEGKLAQNGKIAEVEVSPRAIKPDSAVFIHVCRRIAHERGVPHACP